MAVSACLLVEAPGAAARATFARRVRQAPGRAASAACTRSPALPEPFLTALARSKFADYLTVIWLFISP